MTTIIVADDHPLFRGALKQTLLDAKAEFARDLNILEAKDIDTTYQLLTQHSDTDLLLLDLHIPGAQGFSGLVNLRGCFPFVPIAMFSGSDAGYIIERAANLGASGFIPKSTAPDLIVSAIQTLLSGEHWYPSYPSRSDQPTLNLQISDIAEKVASLTPHQFRVYTMINEGLLNKQIAYELDISETTVKSHVKMILKKMGVRKRTEVIILANTLQVENPDDLLSRESD